MDCCSIMNVDGFVAAIVRLRHKVIRKSHKRESPQLFVYRGQSDCRHKLVSSLHRVRESLRKQGVDIADDMDQTYVPLEKRIIALADRYEAFKTDLDRMAFLQHLGAPTRLLDVSYDELVALYFAVNGNSDVDGKVFVIGVLPEELERMSERKFKGEDLSIDLIRFRQPKTGGAIRNNRKTPCGPCLKIIRPQTDRQKCQQGVFYLMNDSFNDEDERVKFLRHARFDIEDAGLLVQEVLINKKSKELIKRELQEKFGIDEKRLMPDKDNEVSKRLREAVRRLEKRYDNQGNC